MQWFFVAVILLTTYFPRVACAATFDRCPSIMDNGGNNMGSGNNDAAYATTAALGPSGQSCIFFPPGTYNFASQATISLAGVTGSVTVMGSGQDVVRLVWQNNGGLKFVYNTQYQSVHVRDVSILGGSVGGGSGIFLDQTTTASSLGITGTNDITNVTIRGADGYASAAYWQYGIEVVSASEINFDGISIWGAATPGGTGVYLTSSSDAIGVAYNFSKCDMSYLNEGINYGTYIQGVTVDQSNFGADNYGIYTGSNAVGTDQLTVSNSQFYGLIASILENYFVANTVISHNLFIVPNASTAVQLLSSGLFSIVGNTFNGSGNQSSGGGVAIGGTINNYPGIITGNVFAISCSNCVNLFLQSTSKNVNVQSNVYLGVAIVNSGSQNTLGGSTP